jgi:hypothetical protein
MLPTVTFPSATATASPSEGECTERYGSVPAEPTIDPSTGRKKFAYRVKPSPEALECMRTAQAEPAGKSPTHIWVMGSLGVSWLAYYLYSKRRGTWTSLGEDVAEVKNAFADAREERERERAEQERIEQEQWERELAERQQWEQEQPVYPNSYSEPTYTEPAPTAPAPTAPAPRNDDDGWDF